MILQAISVRKSGAASFLRASDGQVAVIDSRKARMVGGYVFVGRTQGDLPLFLAEGEKAHITNDLIIDLTDAVSFGQVLLQTVTVLEALHARRAHSVRAVVGSNFRDPTSKNVPIFPILYHLDTSVGNALQAHCSCTLR